MKKLLTIILAVCVGLLVIAKILSCKTKEQKVMEKEILTYVDATTFGNFERQSIKFLKDEIRDSLLYYRMKISWDKCFLDLYMDVYDEPDKVEYYKDELIRDKDRQDYLISIQDDYNLLNVIAIMTYRLTYMYKDENGDNKVDIFDAAFDSNREMIAYRPSVTARWVKVPM